MKQKLKNILPLPLLELFIAWRYMRSQERVPLFNMGTRVSLLFMALMVFVMIIVLSVFVGFQETVHQTLKNSGYHMRVVPQNGEPFSGYKRILRTVQRNPELQNQLRQAFASISLNILFESHKQFEGKGLRAIPCISKLSSGSENRFESDSSVEKAMAYFPRLVHYNKKYIRSFDRGNYVLIGREMARHYGLQVGNRISLLFPKGAYLSKDLDIKQKSFIIAGFYRTGFYEFDSNLIFMSLRTAQRILELPARASELIFQLKSLEDLDRAQEVLAQSLPKPNHQFTIHTIREEHGNFLAALQLEKTLMLIILSLLIIAGVAGIWVTVRLLIRSKTRSIGMLRSMGMSRYSLLFIFSLHSMFIGFLATAIGGSLGIYVANRMETLIILIEDMINNSCNALFDNCTATRLIPANIYYFDHLPVQAEPGIVFGIALSTLILSGLAGYLPAREAIRLDPIQSIRNE